MSELITTIILVVLGAAVCACLEAAFFSVTLSNAKLLREKGRRGGALLVKVKEKLHHSIITLVILNNGITIAGSIFVGHLATEMYGNDAIGLVSGVLTVTIILLGEIIPKMAGENYATSIALVFAPPVYVLTKIFRPITFLLDILTKGFIKKNRVVSEEELRMLSEMGEAEGSIEHDEQVLIQRVFTLNDLTAKDIMTPRMVVEALPAGATVRDVSVVLLNKPYSRYPVYSGSLDKIVGVASTTTLLAALARDNDRELVSNFMTASIFVPEKKRVDDLMGLFLSKRNHMAIVQDEYGGTTGLVTFEDVIEQLVGEIMDETDEVADLRKHAEDRHSAGK